MDSVLHPMPTSTSALDFSCQRSPAPMNPCNSTQFVFFFLTVFICISCEDWPRVHICTKFCHRICKFYSPECFTVMINIYFNTKWLFRRLTVFVFELLGIFNHWLVKYKMFYSCYLVRKWDQWCLHPEDFINILLVYHCFIITTCFT